MDLEAVVEDASNEVYSFEIQRSLIYLKFVWIVEYHHTITESYQKSTFYQNPSQGGIISVKSHCAQLCLGTSSESSH